MPVETVPEKPVAKTVSPELRLEDIGATDKEGNALQQANAVIARASRELVKFVANGKNPARKCKATVTIKITIANGPTGAGESGYSAMAQVELKTPAPLPKLDILKGIETDRGTPTLARGYPEDEGEKWVVPDSAEQPP